MKERTFPHDCSILLNRQVQTTIRGHKPNRSRKNWRSKLNHDQSLFSRSGLGINDLALTVRCNPLHTSKIWELSIVLIMRFSNIRLMISLSIGTALLSLKTRHIHCLKKRTRLYNRLTLALILNLELGARLSIESWCVMPARQEVVSAWSPQWAINTESSTSRKTWALWAT